MRQVKYQKLHDQDKQYWDEKHNKSKLMQKSIMSKTSKFKVNIRLLLLTFPLVPGSHVADANYRYSSSLYLKLIDLTYLPLIPVMVKKTFSFSFLFSELRIFYKARDNSIMDVDDGGGDVLKTSG